jgi:hypothetical protein
MEVLLQFTSSLEATFTPSYDKAHYILYPEVWSMHEWCQTSI